MKITSLVVVAAAARLFFHPENSLSLYSESRKPVSNRRTKQRRRGTNNVFIHSLQFSYFDPNWFSILRIPFSHIYALK